MTSFSQKTYYEVLEISPDSQSIDVKKAYRKLALKHHPDRNNGSAESTERFKEIGEAYEVLSDKSRRAEYDRSLSSPFHTGTPGRTTPHDGGMSSTPYGRTRDPFAQFNDLFRNDPFFQEAFRDMDDVFSQKFQGKRTRSQTTGGQQKQGWVPWLLNKCGIDFQMTTTTSTPGGGFSTSSYSSKTGAAATYTDRKTKSYIDEDGQRVMVQSLERDGNRIEDKYVGQRLVERRVNGVIEPLERIKE